MKKKFFYMLVRNTFQYKQCLCILTLTNVMNNFQTRFAFTDERKKKLRVPNDCKGSFCQCKNHKYIQI